jgi:hypothetical protein
MPVITDKTNELRDTIISAMLEINAACWYLRKDQNTGDGSAPGLLCLLPKEVQFQVQFGKDGAINAITRTQSQTSGTATESSTELSGERVQTSQSKVSDGTEETTQQRTTNDGPTSTTSTTQDSGGDKTKVKRTYGEVSK